ncbi:MAG: hypothetical protein LZF63_06765, partial [Nitrosomonas sp.]|nr:hypothetical protein [Nitrosomonas sp.]
AAPPHVVPASLPTLDNLSQDAQPKNVPAWLLDLLKRYPFIPYLLLALILLLIIVLAIIGASAGIWVAAAVAGAGL